MRASTVLVPLIAALAAPAASQPRSPLPLGDFRSVELDGGGTVTVRHGSVRGLALREGSLAISRVRLDGDRLVIERCPDRRCPHRYGFEVEVTTPELVSVAVENGGVLRTSGGFPAQPRVAAAVGNGGTVDIRSLSAARVAAAVAQGGRIFTRPGEDLIASVVNGGIVTYWGDATVHSSILHGGVIAPGADEDLDRPVAELGPQPLAPLLPIPALAPPPAKPATEGE